MMSKLSYTLAGAVLLGAAVGCGSADDAVQTGDLPRSVGIDAAVADGRITAEPVTQEALTAGSAAEYEALVAEKPAAPAGHAFVETPHRASGHIPRDVQPSETFKLILDLPKADYVLGEPVILRATVTNVTAEPQQIAPLLDPIFDRFKVTVTTPDGDRPYFSMVEACTLPTLAVRTLQPGESFTNDVRLVAPKGGWMFSEVGDYSIQASLKGMTAAGELVVAEPVDLTVLAGSADDQAVAKMVMDSQAAVLLDWRDGDNLPKGQATLETIFRQYPGTIDAIYAGHVLGNIWANDFATVDGARKADPARALRYLEPTFRRVIEPGAPVVAWDVVAGLAELTAESQHALGRTADARATLSAFIDAAQDDPFQADAIDHARDLLQSY